jgi:hypothetical protein
MSTLLDPSARAACHARIAELTPDRPRQWGRMTAPQMVCHLNDAFLVATGEKPASSVENLFRRTVMKWGALRLPMKWPPDVKTRPELDQAAGGGTPPGEWASDCAQLRGHIDAFARREQFAAHPFFGKMSRNDWMIWGYRHVDHHLRQFGV